MLQCGSTLPFPAKHVKEKGDSEKVSAQIIQKRQENIQHPSKETIFVRSTQKKENLLRP